MDYGFADPNQFHDIEEVVRTVLTRHNGRNYRIEVVKNCRNDNNPFSYRTYVAVEEKAKRESIWKQCFASYDGCQEESFALQWAFREIRERQPLHILA